IASTTADDTARRVPASLRILRRNARTVSPWPAALRATCSHRSIVENANCTGSPVIGCWYVLAASASSAARSSPRLGGAASNGRMTAWGRLARRSWRLGVVGLVFVVLTVGDDIYAVCGCLDTRILCGSPATLTKRSPPATVAWRSERASARG